MMLASQGIATWTSIPLVRKILPLVHPRSSKEGDQRRPLKPVRSLMKAFIWFQIRSGSDQMQLDAHHQPSGRKHNAIAPCSTGSLPGTTQAAELGIFVPRRRPGRGTDLQSHFLTQASGDMACARLMDSDGLP